MTYARAHAVCMVLLGCGHDVDSLVTTPGSWLPLTAGQDCVDCAVGMCLAEERACASDRICVVRYQMCDAPSPTCGVGSLQTRAFASCVIGLCRDRCGFTAERELHCVRNYSWPMPERNVPSNVFVDLAAFAAEVPSTTLVELCTDKYNCEPFVHVEDNRYRASYRFQGGSQIRPFVRVHGVGVQTALYYEGADISNDYLLSITTLLQLEYAVFVQQAGGVADDTHGTIGAVMYGCSTARMSGVAFRLERDGVAVPPAQQGIPYYFVGTSPPRPSSQVTQTQDTNLGGFANITPGVYSVVALLNGTPIGRVDNIAVEPGTLTQVNIFPLTVDQPQ